MYDEFVQGPKFERELANIETRLTDLGISGKIARLALFKDASELIRDEVQRGATTVIAVGNDLTLRKVIDAAADLGAALGVIPLGNAENEIANILGVPTGLPACDVISARIIEEIDTGVVNGQRFIHQCTIEEAREMHIAIQDYTITPVHKARVEVRNLALADDQVPAANPTDGKLELVVRSQKKKWFGKREDRATLVPVDELLMQAEKPVKIRVDGALFEGNQFHVKVLKGHLRLITGKERKFNNSR